MREIATCTCRVCGKTFEKELYESGKGASRRLSEKVKWAENGGIDLCSDCFRAERRAADVKAGLTCDIRLGNVMDEKPVVWGVFGGDTLSHKDDLKAAGCRWTDEYPTGNVLGDMLGFDRVRKTWTLCGGPDDVNHLIETAESLGASVTYPDKETMDMWIAFRAESLRLDEERRQKKAESEAARKAEIAAKLETLGPKPTWPERIRALWPDGGKWNGKVYGRIGRYSVYLGGVKIEISNDEADQMEKTLTARREWEQKKKEIEGS